ncbi:MAG: quinolinate synthase NadA [bacterium]
MTAGGAELQADIARLKRETGALILAHNYQLPEVYPVADFIGDSLELARQAAQARSRFIVFCGVRFMAETAKLLSPDARVVLAEPGAGCQMADMVTAGALAERRRQLGDVAVVSYVNTPADVKAESDICCTSANAVAVVRSVPADRRILFVPDRNLAAWAALESGRELIPWPGFCYVHATFTPADVERARQRWPGATVIVHPECPLEVIRAADRVASTGGMLRLAQELGEVVLGTEAGMCARIARDYPDVRCHPLRRTALCANMKRTTLASVRRALLGEVEEITIPVPVATRARVAIERMLAVG